MTKNKSLYTDYEYTIMQKIADNNNVTQRELSKNLGVSLGTVNVVMNKMVREGLIKMTQVSQKQVLYMLTPVGILTKAKKTVSYLKAHYKAIDSTKQRLKSLFTDLNEYYHIIYLLIKDQEIREVVDIAICELNRENILIHYEFIDIIDRIDLKNENEFVLVFLEQQDDDSKIPVQKIQQNLTQINLLEYL